MTDHKTIPERADEVIRKISCVLDCYTEEFLKLEKAGELTDDLAAEMVLAEHNFSELSALCELDPVGFVECYADVADMDEEDILYGLLIKQKGEEHEEKQA